MREGGCLTADFPSRNDNDESIDRDDQAYMLSPTLQYIHKQGGSHTKSLDNGFLKVGRSQTQKNVHRSGSIAYEYEEN